MADPEGSTANLEPSQRSPMDTLFNQKKVLRTLVRQKLRQLPSEQRAVEDDAVQQHILAADWFQKSQRICAYISCASLREVATDTLLARILESHNKSLYVPRVQDKQSHMCMLRIRNTTEDVAANSMGIMEPTPILPDGTPRDDLLSAEEPLDLLLLPGLAFDRLGGRLGRGGGYYDLFIQTYLERAKSKGWRRPLLVALSYKIQIQEEAIPMDQTDVRVDAVMSADGLLTFARKEEPVLGPSL